MERNKMTPKEFDQQLQELIANIQQNCTPFKHDTPEEQKKRLERASKDFFYFAKTYFPHYIKANPCKKHKDIHHITEREGIHAVAGFRGFGKTTLLAIIKPIWRALFGQSNFVIEAAENERLATNRNKEIKANVLMNNRIIYDFKPQVEGEVNDYILSGTRFNCKFLARGYQQPVRGLFHYGNRPDFIVVDDLESHLSFNPRIADEKLKFVQEECFGAFQAGRGTVVWLGNLTHQTSAFFLFKKKCEKVTSKDLTFTIVRSYEVVKGRRVPTWREEYPLQVLDRIKHIMGTAGFERHYQMNPMIEGLKFKAEWIRYEDFPTEFEKIITYVDPSLSSKKTADYKAIITLGYAKGKYYLLDAWIRKASIDTMLHYLYKLDKEYNTLIFMEANFWQSILWEFIPDISTSYGYYLPVFAVINSEKKEVRIEKLEPPFERARIIFPKDMNDDIQLLIEMLLGYPDHPHDDGPDALSGAVTECKINREVSYQPVGQKRTSFKQLM